MRRRLLARLFVAAAFVVVGAPIASAQTVADRLRALEAKTGFYTTSTKRLLLNYRKGEPTGTCISKKLVFIIDPALSMAGTSYIWLQTIFKYQRVPGSQRVFAVEWSSEGGSNVCSVSGDPLSEPSGTITLKRYCALDVQPGDKIHVTVSLSNEEDGELDACQYTATARLQLKLVNVGIHEPD